MIERILDRFCTVLRVMLGVLMGVLAVPVALQIISRLPLIPNFLWTEELATFLFIWIVMIGSIVAVWDGTHFDVRITRDAQSPVWRLVQNGTVHLSIMIFGAIFAIYGIHYFEFGTNQRSLMMRVNMGVTHIAVPIAGLLWLIFSTHRLFQEIARFRSETRASS